jgi:hypothetical protein
MSLPVVDIDSWDAFVAEVSRRVEKAGPGQFCFRGQSSFAWTLEPSMLRLLKDSPDFCTTKAHQIEESFVDEFMSSNGSQLKDKCGSDSFSRWALMQHFCAPTRLLDWTFSPSIAAYFAVNENWLTDGALWFFDRAALRLLNERVLRFRPENLPRVVPSGGMSIAVTHDWHEKEAIGTLTNFEVRGTPFLNERLIAQKGVFTVSTSVLDNHEEVLQSLSARLNKQDNRMVIGKMRIPAMLKTDFLKRLRDIDISAKTLFPGMDGVGRSMTELLRSRHTIPRPN